MTSDPESESESESEPTRSPESESESESEQHHHDSALLANGECTGGEPEPDSAYWCGLEMHGL